MKITPCLDRQGIIKRGDTMRNVLKFAKENNLKVKKSKYMDDSYSIYYKDMRFDIRRHESSTVFTIRGWQGDPAGYKLKTVAPKRYGHSIWYKTQKDMIEVIKRNMKDLDNLEGI